MKVSELRALSEAELAKHLDESFTELFNLKLRLTTRQLVNHRQIPVLKKSIAQIQTIITEKKAGAR